MSRRSHRLPLSWSTFQRTARAWLAINSVTDRSNLQMVQAVEVLFRVLGCRIRRQRIQRNGITLFNVVGWLGPTKQSGLVLHTHLDTVPPGVPERWTKLNGRPWSPKSVGNRLYGLGSADTKLDLLCKIQAVAQLQPMTLHRPLMLVGACAEESGMIGVGQLLEGNLVRPSSVLVGEPSELQIIHRHKGYLVCQIDLRWHRPRRPQGHLRRSRSQWVGREAHSSTPRLGDSAIQQALEGLRRLQQVGLPTWVHRADGGTVPNQVAAQCAVDLITAGELPGRWARQCGAKVTVGRLSRADVPVLPLEPLLDTSEHLERVLRRWCRRHMPAFNPPTLTWNWGRIITDDHRLRLLLDVRPLPGQPHADILLRLREGLNRAMALTSGVSGALVVERNNASFHQPRRSQWVRQLQTAARRVGLSARLGTKVGCTEAGVYQAAGVPAVVFGPGRALGNIHRPNEHVTWTQLKHAVQFYRQVIESSVGDRP